MQTGEDQGLGTSEESLFTKARLFWDGISHSPLPSPPCASSTHQSITQTIYWPHIDHTASVAPSTAPAAGSSVTSQQICLTHTPQGHR